MLAGIVVLRTAGQRKLGTRTLQPDLRTGLLEAIFKNDYRSETLATWILLGSF
jgi:hypothetical protein